MKQASYALSLVCLLLGVFATFVARSSSEGAVLFAAGVIALAINTRAER